MPVVKLGQPMPLWCELTAYDVIRLAPGEKRYLPRRDARVKVTIADGDCAVDATPAARGETVEIVAGTPQFAVAAGPAGTEFVAMHGHWGDETGGVGLFGLANEPGGSRSDMGDKTAYPKHTSFDAHYHDCDEYWIVVGGLGTVVSEGRHFEVGPGDCVATGMGHHHDFPEAPEPVTAVFFETTMEGEKRPGHLWDHMHGPAKPKANRL